MSEPHDVYHDWLGIRATHRPLNNYELLGLPVGETRLHAIEEAAARQVQTLERHLTGDQARLAKRLAFEIESAKLCLVDPKKKAAYDALLPTAGATSQGDKQKSPTTEAVGKRLPVAKPLDKSPPARSSTPIPIKKSPRAKDSTPIQIKPTFSSPDVSRIAEFLDQEMPAALVRPTKTADTMSEQAPVRHQRTHRKKPRNISIILGVVGVAGILLLLLFVASRPTGIETAKGTPESKRRDFYTESLPPPPPPPPAVRKPSVQAKKTPVSSTVPSPKSTTPRRKAPANAKAPETKPLQSQPKGKEGDPFGDFQSPVSMVPQKPSQRPLSPPKPTSPSQQLDAIPDWLDLAPPDEGKPATPVRIGRLPSTELRMALHAPSGKSSGDIELTLKALPPQMDGPKWLVEASRKPIADSSTMMSTKQPPVALGHFILKERELSFHWAANFSSEAASVLHSSVVELQTPDRVTRTQLHEPTRMDAVVLDMDKTTMRIPLQMSSGIANQQLLMKLEGMEQFPSSPAVEPEAAHEGTSREIRLRLRDEEPEVQWRIRITRIGREAALTMAGVVPRFDGDSIPFTNERIDAMKETLPAAIEEAMGTMRGLEARRADIQARASQAKSSLRGPALAVVIQSLESEMKDLIGRAKSVSRQLQSFQRRLTLLPPLLELRDNTHKKSSLKLRIFFLAGECPVDVLRAGVAAQDARAKEP